MTHEASGTEPAWKRLSDLGSRISGAVPPIDPPGCYWMTSDASASYCRECARKAAWKEMGREGEPPEEIDWWRRTKAQTRVEEQIGDLIGGPSWGESDSGEACTECRRTLSHLLTDYGRDEELSHFAENPIGPDDVIDAEMSYTLSRIFMNLDVPSADEDRTREAIVIAEGALAAIERRQIRAKEQRAVSA